MQPVNNPNIMPPEEYKQIRKGYHRAKFIIFLARNIIGAPFKKICNIHCDKIHIDEEPFVLMANHGDNLDAATELIGIRNYMRFVMSDHLTRNPVMRALVKFLASPIIYHREKGSDVLYNEVVANLNAGINVAIYIEGGKTNNGETGYISKRNAKMVKEGNCGLVTYRNKGGYLKVPRWADNKRKGPTYGEVVNIYTKEEIQNMTEDEIYEHLKQDLYFNVYDEQMLNPRQYIAKNPAQSAEIMLYACPKCKKIGTLRSKGDKLSCECSFEATIDSYGFWSGDDIPFDNIVSWDKFQKNLLKEITTNSKNTTDFLFSDSQQTVYTLRNENRELLCNNSSVSLFGDRIEIQTETDIIVIPVNEIKRIRIASKMTILIITDSEYYEIHSRIPRSATKYSIAVRYLQGKENY